MANRAGPREDLSGLAHMVAVVAPETPGPVTVTYVTGIGCPVDFHGEEDTVVENGGNGVDSMVHISFSILKDIRVIFEIVCFDTVSDSFMGTLTVSVVFQQGFYGKLLDPGKF
jgi:hypothetical protein